MATAATITSGINNAEAGVPLKPDVFKMAVVKFTTVGADSYTFGVNSDASSAIAIDTTNLSVRACTVSGSVVTVVSCQGTADHIAIVFCR